MGEVTGKGTLYVVATPIGNLEDITLRALRVLQDVSVIAAEDTRRTRKLLSAHGIHTPLVSLYDQVEKSRSGALLSRLKEGLDIAYVSDAGTPGISDPGYVLINRALTGGIRVVPVPGASAVIAALSVAGLPMDGFVFIGFPPNRGAKRKQLLDSLKEETRTLVFYESPRRVTGLLEEIRDVFGDRNVAVARELTKVFEEVLRGGIDDVLQHLRQAEVKGEVTLIVAGKGKTPRVVEPENVAARFRALRRDGRISVKDAVRMIAEEMDVPKKEVYQEVLKLLNDPTEPQGENP